MDNVGDDEIKGPSIKYTAPACLMVGSVIGTLIGVGIFLCFSHTTVSSDCIAVECVPPIRVVMVTNVSSDACTGLQGLANVSGNVARVQIRVHDTWHSVWDDVVCMTFRDGILYAYRPETGYQVCPSLVSSLWPVLTQTEVSIASPVEKGRQSLERSWNARFPFPFTCYKCSASYYSIALQPSCQDVVIMQEPVVTEQPRFVAGMLLASAGVVLGFAYMMTFSYVTFKLGALLKSIFTSSQTKPEICTVQEDRVVNPKERKAKNEHLKDKDKERKGKEKEDGSASTTVIMMSPPSASPRPASSSRASSPASIRKWQARRTITHSELSLDVDSSSRPSSVAFTNSDKCSHQTSNTSTSSGKSKKPRKRRSRARTPDTRKPPPLPPAAVPEIQIRKIKRAKSQDTSKKKST